MLSAITIRGETVRQEVEPEVMNSIFEDVKTPYKYGVVLEPEKGKMLDNPNVFRMEMTKGTSDHFPPSVILNLTFVIAAAGG